MTRKSNLIISACERDPSPENQARVRHLVDSLTGEVQRFKRENGEAYKFIASTGMKLKRPLILAALYRMWSELRPQWPIPALPTLKRSRRKA